MSLLIEQEQGGSAGGSDFDCQQGESSLIPFWCQCGCLLLYPSVCLSVCLSVCVCVWPFFFSPSRILQHIPTSSRMILTSLPGPLLSVYVNNMQSLTLTLHYSAAIFVFDFYSEISHLSFLLTHIGTSLFVFYLVLVFFYNNCWFWTGIMWIWYRYCVS